MKNSLKTCLFAAVAFAALCTGCAETKDESSVPEVTTTAATTTEATTTAATTTTVTEATTTASTEETEEEVKPDTETSDNTPALGTTQDKPEIEEPQPEVNTTPDGKYTLADTDLVNTDGTYTQNEFNGDTLPLWACSYTYTVDDQQYFKNEGKASCPSLIPYSEITLENAAEAFPFLGYIGYKPNYTMILPTDDADRIAAKVYDNLIGNEPSSGYDLWQYYNFTSEADYKQYLADKEAAGQARDEEIAANAADDDYTMIGDGDSGEGILDDFAEFINN